MDVSGSFVRISLAEIVNEGIIISELVWGYGVHRRHC